MDINSNPPGKAAIGYIWYERNSKKILTKTKEGSLYIGQGHSSYSAEAIALLTGINNDPQIEQETKQRIGIFTDSLSNLSTIKKGIAKTREQEQLLESINKYPHSLVFHHVRAHRNNKKNMEVDELCAISRISPDRANHEHKKGSKTAAQAKQWLKSHDSFGRRRRVITDINAHKRKSQTQTYIRKYLEEDGSMNLRPKEMNELPRKTGVLLAKARTNRWVQCQEFQHRIGKAESPLCKTCKVIDSTEHVINDCKRHENTREIMLLRLKHSGKVAELLSSTDEKIILNLANFLEEIRDKRLKEENEKNSKKTSKKAKKSLQYWKICPQRPTQRGIIMRLKKIPPPPKSLKVATPPKIPWTNRNQSTMADKEQTQITPNDTTIQKTETAPGLTTPFCPQE